MEKTDNTVDNGKLVFRDVKPEVEAFNELAPDLFPRVGSDVCVRLKQFLG